MAEQKEEPRNDDVADRSGDQSAALTGVLPRSAAGGHGVGRWSFRGTLLAGILFLVPLALYVLFITVPQFHVPEPLQHFVLTLTAVMGVHLIDRLVLFRETYATLAGITEGIQADVGAQTKALAGTSASLQAMIASGIGQLYASRDDAAEDIRRDLADPENRTIRIIGISLNDFLRTDGTTLAHAWNEIRRFIQEDRPIDIKLLLIDPDCLGAQLRSVGEARGQESVVGRLREDVLAVAESLLKLEREVRGRDGECSLECRFYRLAPTLFLCQVDSGCYVQPYYFWSQRAANRASPVIRFRQADTAAQTRLISEGMRDHFEWIWQEASTPAADLLEAHSVGVDKGLHQSGIRNLFASSTEGRARIQWLLENAKERVWIQGVSLRSFFDQGELFQAIASLLGSDVEIRVLFLDRNGTQAKYRSYRERLFGEPDLTLASYLDSGQHNESDLFRDTERSISNLRRQVAAIRGHKGSRWDPNLAVGEYDSAPACFMLRVDDQVLVEQYHYGKVVPDGQQEAPAILGKDMPLLEYARASSPLYDEVPLRSPFALLNDHFDFAFRMATHVAL